MGGVTYSYDGDGDRTWRGANGQATLYMLDKQAPLTVVLNEQNLSNYVRYVHGLTGLLAQQNPAGVFQWTLQDGLQSLRGMSDGNDMLSAQAYSPYGEPMFTDMPTEFGFTGEQTDPLNDLVYLRARYLNPKLGIFSSQDTYEGNINSPEFNIYNYVGGNPINRNDPTGHCFNNPNSTLNQQSECSAHFTAYRNQFDTTKGVYNEFVEQENIWGQLSYDEFMTRWSNPATQLPVVGTPPSPYDYVSSSDPALTPNELEANSAILREATANDFKVLDIAVRGSMNFPYKSGVLDVNLEYHCAPHHLLFDRTKDVCGWFMTLTAGVNVVSTDILEPSASFMGGVGGTTWPHTIGQRADVWVFAGSIPTDPLGIVGVSSSADLTMSGSDFMLMTGKTFSFNNLPSTGAGVYKGVSIYLGPTIGTEEAGIMMWNSVREYVGLSTKPCP